MSLDIKKTVRGSLPRFSFEKIARSILGEKYSLSLVVSGDSLARTINKKYRRIDYSPNVLSFPLQKNEGEIILNVRRASREARAFHITPLERIAFLFIHGCLHLKGLRHGKSMDKLEDRYLKKSGVKITKP